MDTNAYSQILAVISEPALLITDQGVIVATNRAMAQMASLQPQALNGTPLKSHVINSLESINDYLKSIAKADGMVPGSLMWHTEAENKLWQCEAVLLRPKTADDPALFVLKGQKPYGISEVTGLNDRIDNLTRELSEEKQGQLAQARLAAIVESSDDAIVGKNLQGIITSWNQGAQRIFGYAAQEMIGRSILALLPVERQSEEADILSRLCRGERVDHFETIRVTKDGRRIPVSLTISPIRDTDGKIIGASKIARDITDRKKYEQEREYLLDSERAARQEAERASRIKDEFLATLSHELRTPLNAILGWAHIMRTSQMDAQTIAQGAEIIERNTRVQTQLVDDLLDMSRIISGKLRLDVQRVEMQPVIEAAIAVARPAAEAKGIRIQTVIDSMAASVKGDAARLQQVVWNLLSNALKFTPRGGRVQILLERINSHLQISVSDSGQGISADFLPFVFDRFRQADASTTRTHGGLGLGLAIVKHLVELHGGTVVVRSEGKDKGSTFVILLPIAVVHPEEERPEQRRQENVDDTIYQQIDLSGVRVLVVDDEPDALLLIKRLLEDSRAQVTTAQSVSEALKALADRIPDVLLSDIGMPGEDGYSLMRQLRSMPAEKGGRIPAVALTAFARQEDRRRAMLAGFHLHLSKPVDAGELRAVVGTLAGRNAMPTVPAGNG